MSADGSIDLDWADGHHRFRLALGQLRELQEKINGPRVALGATPIGPFTLLQLAVARDLWPQEVREIVRLGLIGGGMKPIDALALVIRYVDERPLLESLPPAALILRAALVGVPDDNKTGKKKRQKRSMTTGSSSPPSTGTAQPWDGQSTRSTDPRSGSSPPPSTAGTGRTATATTTPERPAPISSMP